MKKSTSDLKQLTYAWLAFFLVASNQKSGKSIRPNTFEKSTN